MRKLQLDAAPQSRAACSISTEESLQSSWVRACRGLGYAAGGEIHNNPFRLRDGAQRSGHDKDTSAHQASTRRMSP